ncbi:MAG TPA: GntR family transcriptional regulator [Streptosporangiaceae bacterium]|nr:GntR family transcriptional regulator [Streptosporangiaceae bacterium]
MAERDLYKPLYLVIADDLRARIKSGELKADTRLPSERELCERWDCSAITARHAMTALRSEGLIYTLKGKGAFVSKRPPLVRVSPDRYPRDATRQTFHREGERSGVAVHAEHSTERVEAPAEAAERLGIEEGDPVTETVYKIDMDGEPVSFSVCWEPLAITGGTEIEFPHEGPHAGRGIVPRFDAIGLHVDVKEEFLHARMPEPHEAIRLKAPPGVPVIVIWQTFWAGDVAVEAAKITHRADRYEFHYRTNIE